MPNEFSVRFSKLTFLDCPSKVEMDDINRTDVR